MSDWLEKAGKFAGASSNILRSIGSWCISQSERSSEAFARHKGRLASVDLSKELVSEEIKNYSSIQKKLMEQWTDASAEERVRIRQDLNEIEGTLRQFGIVRKAIAYLPGDSESQAESEAKISPHWVDRFNELARQRNEPWREELLARVLAKESSLPGSVSTRALWLIGTLEEESFQAFSMLLDLCSYIAFGLMIPHAREFLEQVVVPHNINLGVLTHRLRDLGLIGDPVTTGRMLPKDGEYEVRYSKEGFIIGCPIPLTVPGVVLTRLGESLASFHQFSFHDFGKKIFDSWIAGLDRNVFKITPLETGKSDS